MSGFQLHFSSDHIFTPGDDCDVLVAMNAAALKTNLKSLKKGGRIIVNIEGFDTKNLRLANYPEGVNPLDDNSLDNFDVIRVDVTKLTRETLKDIPLGTKEKDRAKNMFVLGFYTGCITGSWIARSSFSQRNLVRSRIYWKVISAY
ncbi:MAG: 2-oxoacid:acceptor oxidoreductase family protein [Puia sp.]